jgi:hypothetical protein
MTSIASAARADARREHRSKPYAREIWVDGDVAVYEGLTDREGGSIWGDAFLVQNGDGKTFKGRVTWRGQHYGYITIVLGVPDPAIIPDTWEVSYFKQDTGEKNPGVIRFKPSDATQGFVWNEKRPFPTRP